MVIEEKDFKLTSDTGIFWDLELLHTIRPKGKPERQEFAIEGYGLSLPSCMKRIINYRLSNKKEVYNLKEFLSEYVRESNELKTILKDF